MVLRVDQAQKQLLGSKLASAWQGGQHPQKFPTPNSFLQPSTSNLVHNLGSGVARQNNI